MNINRTLSIIIAAVMTLAIAVPAFGVNGVTAEFVVPEPANYSLEISSGSLQSLTVAPAGESAGEDIVVTNTGNRGVFWSMVADTLPTNENGQTLQFATSCPPAADEICWVVQRHADVDGAKVYITTTAAQIYDGAVGPGESQTFHSFSKAGTSFTNPGTYTWSATIIATDENAADMAF